MLAAGEAGAQNPIIQTRYTADPAACVYGDTLYLYTSVDNEEGEGYQKTIWQLYTTTDMVNWTDCGTVASLADFSWAGDNGAWAPHVVPRDGNGTCMPRFNCGVSVCWWGSLLAGLGGIRCNAPLSTMTYATSTRPFLLMTTGRLTCIGEITGCGM